MPVILDVTHAWYGCETGCCGHEVTIKGRDGRMFFMEHYDPKTDGSPEDYARSLVKQITDDQWCWMKAEIDRAGGFELGEVEIVSYVECTW